MATKTLPSQETLRNLLHKKRTGRPPTHGLTRTTTYTIWRGMKRRCSDPKAKDYNRYGGKGILICERWKDSFENFLHDMGERPSKNHTLDRIDSAGNYEPTNCRWATWKEQQNNRCNNLRIEFNGVTKTTAEWTAELGFSRLLINDRLGRGWSIKDALSTVPRRRASSVKSEPLLRSQPDHSLN